MGKQKQLVGTKYVEVDTWDTPFEIQVNVSVPTGTIVNELFGTKDDYSLIVITTNTSLKINHQTKVWIDTKPNIKCDNNDYLIETYKPSINSIAIALKQRVIGGNKDFWLSYYDSETTTYTQPYKVRLNTEINDDLSLSVYINNNDNVIIDEMTLIWFNTDYSDELDNYNYKYSTKYTYKNITKYILIQV